jgi:hypothetical protein
VKANFADDEGYLMEADHPECRTLVYITQSIAADPLPSMESSGVHVLRVKDL